MFDRLSLKSVLLGGCCLILPISYATGENGTSSPLGTVLPAASPQTSPLHAAHVSAVLPASVQSPDYAPNGAVQANPVTTKIAMTVAPAAPVANAPVVVPIAPNATSVPAQVQTIPLRPGENPFSPQPRAQTTVGVEPRLNEQQLLSVAPSAPRTPAEAANQPEKAVDETALRYYASQRDLKRLGAEIRRLKALYPEWEAPEDLFDQPTNISEQPLWDMFARGDYAGVHNEIARLQVDNVNWKPSSDLQNKLALAETRTLMERSFAQRNWNQVIMLAEATPGLMVCQEMNAIWLTAESLARVQDFSRSFDLYKYVISTCDNANERLATVQKASLVLPEAGFMSLAMMGKRLPDGTSEFEDVAFNPLRAKMGSIARGDVLSDPVSNDELQRFADFVQRKQLMNDASLFGWYYYSQKAWNASYQWFNLASRLGYDTKNIEGIILNKRNMDQLDEAIALAKAHLADSKEITKIYIELIADGLTNETPMVLKGDDFQFFKGLVLEQESALGAQALGWYLMSQKKTAEASELFNKSVAWEPTEGGVMGQAVVAARAKRWSTVSSIKAKYGDEFEGLSQIQVYRTKYTPRRNAGTASQHEPPNLVDWLSDDKKKEKRKKIYYTFAD
ncbi:hypothetical protein [Rhizobium sp. SL86]|jgi:hypothetical protein|uniref:hypothetical protein n=1 Tax=Rhizobium sp. SL86 TaxID=2995148 RepID=UPI002272C440|nr:hypothetical protein [Rhizobium sp. SL86]MCY1669034.1 hypothetical protein [Rhizobium sp. SL86]